MDKSPTQKIDWPFVLRHFLFIMLALLTFPPCALLPMLLLLRRQGLKPFVIAMVAAAFLLVWLHNEIIVVMTILPILTAFWVIETSAKEHTQIERVFSRYLIYVVAIGGLLSYSITQINPELYNATIAHFKQIFEGLYGDSAIKLLESFKYNGIAIGFSILLILFSFSYYFYLLADKILSKSDVNMQKVMQYTLPSYLIWYLLVFYILNMISVEPLSQIGNNLMIMLLSMYFIQGSFIAVSFALKNDEQSMIKNKGLRWAMVVMGMLGFPYIILGVGLVDRWFDFRKIRNQQP